MEFSIYQNMWCHLVPVRTRFYRNTRKLPTLFSQMWSHPAWPVEHSFTSKNTRIRSYDRFKNLLKVKYFSEFLYMWKICTRTWMSIIVQLKSIVTGTSEAAHFIKTDVLTSVSQTWRVTFINVWKEMWEINFKPCKVSCLKSNESLDEIIELYKVTNIRGSVWVCVFLCLVKMCYWQSQGNIWMAFSGVHPANCSHWGLVGIYFPFHKNYTIWTPNGMPIW